MKLGQLAITLVSVGATALLGCSQDGDAVSKDTLQIGAQVLPQADSLSYAGFARVVDDNGQAQEVDVDELKLRFSSNDRHRQVAYGVGKMALKTQSIDSRGQAAAGGELGAAAELLRALPPAGKQVAIGESYESPAPTPERVERNFADNGKGTMVTHTVYTPTAIMSRNGITVLRAATVSSYRLHFVRGDAGTHHHLDLGVVSKGVVDMAHSKGEGWRVVRLARVTPTAKDESTKTSSMEALRGQAHKSFTACLRGNTSSASMQSIAGLALPFVPELSACDQ